MARTIVSSMSPATAAAASIHLADLGLDAQVRAFSNAVSIITYRNPHSETEMSIDARLILFGNGEMTTLFDSAGVGDQPLSATLSVDFEVDDEPEPCPHCPAWWSERVVDLDGLPVLREWHQRTCPIASGWA